MRKRLTAMLLSLALLVAMVPAATLQARAESYVSVEEGLYALSPMCAPNARLDVADAKKTNKTNIQICETNGNTAQIFQISHVGDGWYKITAKVSGKVLDLQMGESTSGTNVWQYTDNGTDAQRWKFLDAGDGYYYIVPKKNTDLRLDVYYEGSASGTNVQVWRANETSAQKWKLIKLDGQSDAGQADIDTFVNMAKLSLGKTRTDLGLPSGDWCGRFVGYCINNSDVSSSVGTISAADCANALTLAKWICATENAGVFYSVSSAHADRVRQYAGLEGSSRVQDISVLSPCPGDILVFSWDTNWKEHHFDHMAIVTDSDTYVDGNSGSGNGKVASHSISDVKSSIIGYIRFDSMPAQDLADTLSTHAASYVLVEEGEYALAPMCAPGSRLDVADSKRTNKTNIQICEANGNTAQIFQFSHVGDGWYKITAKVSGKVLDLQMGESTSGTNVWQYTDNGTDAQRWKFMDAGDGYYYIVPKKNTGLCLDVYYEGSANGTNVQVWRANETSAQKWKLISLSGQGGAAAPNPQKPIGTTSKPDVSVSGQDVTVSWSYDGSGTSIDVYLVMAPWGWEHIKYSGTTTDNSYTFHNVAPGGYAAFTIARPNSNRTQSVWTDVGVALAPEALKDEVVPEPEPEPDPSPEPSPEPEQEITIVSEGIHPDPYGGWAHYSMQNVDVDGARVVFQMYALKDANGNETNFVKVRDVAQIINGSSAQFNVDYDGDVILTTKAKYLPNGSEMRTPFTGGRTYTIPSGITKIDGVITHMDCIQLVDDGGGGYTYYKLRDLGKALGFNVGWSASRGVYIETYKRYQG